MCFFETKLWTCGHWQWSSFKSHCHKEYDTTGSCRLRLIDSTDRSNKICGVCEEIGRNMLLFEMVKARESYASPWDFAQSITHISNALARLHRRISREGCLSPARAEHTRHHILVHDGTDSSATQRVPLLPALDHPRPRPQRPTQPSTNLYTCRFCGKLFGRRMIRARHMIKKHERQLLQEASLAG
ncbi:hypothetical protein GQ607_002385 [Colletotrichum asianum]|uniref:C2H2-type domain-containing protein n=1 Tax=Colletotrichum asianum TaxID=702518 RepID=A0A8H3ZWS1_9PEZI|nr:hypothetical protein GQ607_002385 [Colletotrichum asianum]